MAAVTIRLNDFDQIDVDSYTNAVQISIYKETDGGYAEAMLDEDEARAVAAALLAPWEKADKA